MSLSGGQTLVIIRLKFKDTANEPVTPNNAFFTNLFKARNTGGLNDYWIKASLGAINLDPSVILPWKVLTVTRSDFLAAHTSRLEHIQAAIDAVSSELAGIRYHGVVVVLNSGTGGPGAAMRGNVRGVITGLTNLNVTWLAHETGHLFGLSHSFDESDRKLQSWSAPGEYWDRWDIMSALNVFTTPSPNFDKTGPLLCTANLDLQGWLPSSRVFEPRSGASSVNEIDLVSMSNSNLNGYLCAKIGGRWYIEFRQKDGLDAGIPGSGILIHYIDGDSAVVHAEDISTFDKSWEVGDVFGPSDLIMNIFGGTRVEILNFDEARKKARLRITHTLRRRFPIPFPWPEFPTDPIPDPPPFQDGRPPVVGPGLGSDGGHAITLPGGRTTRIPIRSPLKGLLNIAAIAAQAEETLAGQVRGELVGKLYREMEGVIKRAAEDFEKSKG
ncbi:MAG: hypothetical protein M1840_007025 [Geoglossum simile]|nr:MAG: hypothetical protein M1840_007025 [Geoglossum simile]